jgi:tetratricopeptide (TPR) repeat protein
VQHGFGYYYLWEWGFDPRDEALAKVRPSAERALEIEPTNGSAHALLAWLSMRDCDWEGAEARLLRALKATPRHGPLRNSYGWLLLFTGRIEESATHLQRAVALDPAAAWTHYALGVLHLFKGDYEAAIGEFEGRSHSVRTGPLSLARAHQLNGDDERASEVLIRVYAPSPEVAAEWETTFAEGGLVAVNRAVLDHQIARTGRPCTLDPEWASFIFAFIGEADRMFACLEEGIRLKRPAFAVKVAPRFSSYRDDPRFTALLRRMGLEE